VDAMPRTSSRRHCRGANFSDKCAIGVIKIKLELANEIGTKVDNHKRLTDKERLMRMSLGLSLDFRP
jgi:hypothetical protein